MNGRAFLLAPYIRVYMNKTIQKVEGNSDSHGYSY